jgi:diguanylate cyclase (GGDEF)-like protein
MREAIERIRRRFFEFSKDVPPADYRTFVVNTRVLLLTLLGHTTFVPVFIYLAHPLAIFNTVLCIAIDIAGLVLNLRGRVRAGVLAATAGVCWHTGWDILLFGDRQGFQFYLLIMPIVIFFLRMPLLRKFVLSAIPFAILTGTFTYVTEWGPLAPQSEIVNRLVFYANAGTLTLFVVIWADYFRQVVDDMEARLTHQATHDKLTGLPNRAALLAMLESAIANAAKLGEPVSVVMADIDLFKRINDTYGHPGGDAVLRRVAQIVQATLRTRDTLARYGGEEFSLVLPACGTDDARLVLARTQKALRAEAIDVGEGRSAAVTMSFGVTTFQGNDATTIEQMLRRADEALYLAKQNGRDRVEHVALDLPPSPIERRRSKAPRPAG